MPKGFTQQGFNSESGKRFHTRPIQHKRPCSSRDHSAPETESPVRPQSPETESARDLKLHNITLQQHKPPETKPNNTTLQHHNAPKQNPTASPKHMPIDRHKHYPNTTQRPTTHTTAHETQATHAQQRTQHHSTTTTNTNINQHPINTPNNLNATHQKASTTHPKTHPTHLRVLPVIGPRLPPVIGLRYPG